MVSPYTAIMWFVPVDVCLGIPFHRIASVLIKHPLRFLPEQVWEMAERQDQVLSNSGRVSARHARHGGFSIGCVPLALTRATSKFCTCTEYLYMYTYTYVHLRPLAESRPVLGQSYPALPKWVGRAKNRAVSRGRTKTREREKRVGRR